MLGPEHPNSDSESGDSSSSESNQGNQGQVKAPTQTSQSSSDHPAGSSQGGSSNSQGENLKIRYAKMRILGKKLIKEWYKGLPPPPSMKSPLFLFKLFCSFTKWGRITSNQTYYSIFFLKRFQTMWPTLGLFLKPPLHTDNLLTLHFNKSTHGVQTLAMYLS